MSSPYDKLRRILLLEREQSHRNRAVIGGLARFLSYWASEARDAERDTPGLTDRVLAAMQGYADKPPLEREQAVTHLLSLLGSSEQDAPEEDEPVETSAAAQGTPDKDDDDLDATSEDDEEREKDARPAGGPPRSPGRAPGATGGHEGPSLSDPVTTLKGVSTVNQGRLARLGIETIRDLINHFPRRHDDFGNLKTINRLELGDEVTIVGVVRDVQTRRIPGNRTLVQLTLSDGTGNVRATWFNQPYLARSFKLGSEIVLSGKVEQYLGRLVMNAPEWEPLQRELLHTGRLVPVHPLTEGVGARWLRSLIKRTLDTWVPRILDPLPPEIRESAGLIDLQSAINGIHFPESAEALEQARRRLCFDELLLLQIGILRHRQVWRSQPTRALVVPRQEIESFISGLPFALTGAQRRAADEILNDLEQSVPMSRLLQGDVGSGKTVVALIGVLATVRNGLQAAIMAPTSILAEQHFRTISSMLEGQPNVRCALLVGSLAPYEKAALHADIASGKVQVIVGTHALIQEAVDYAQLGLAVVDEQHRFGVGQRSALREKGGELQPHLLAMSATPIPRSLALTLYGDLDISVLDELPPGREPVITAARDWQARERIYSFIRSQVQEGRQAFVIYPLVEDSDSLKAKAAVSEHRRLQEEIFPHLRVGLLHGRMSADEKDATMASFGAGECNILVSTAVVEVGIDIPNASVMLIEGAERFGLAQLHQFRGRVGRGEFKSYCILVSDDPSEVSLERLRIMEETNDGFVLAEKDLEMRGPGDFFGIRQSGLPTLRVAGLSDTAILALARREAQAIFERGPYLASPEHRALSISVDHFWSKADLS